MTSEDLLAEAERLVRPCIHLEGPDAHGAPVAAVWGGEAPPSVPTARRHLVSIDVAQFPSAEPAVREGFPARCLTLYMSDAGGEVALALADVDLATLLDSGRRPNRGGVPLVARDARSLPPLDAVFRFGSSRVRAWLQRCGWLDGSGMPYEYNDNFPDTEPTVAYQRHWQAAHPLYAGQVLVVVGGWHVPWPDGDWAERLEDRLLLWTLGESEPWVELWRSRRGTLEIRERIT